jgi:hypothetical protein
MKNTPDTCAKRLLKVWCFQPTESSSSKNNLGQGNSSNNVTQQGGRNMLAQ